MGMRAVGPRGGGGGRGVHSGAATGFVHAITIKEGRTGPEPPSTPPTARWWPLAVLLLVFLPLETSHHPPHNPPTCCLFGMPPKRQSESKCA